jgi:hypothetical protein
LGLDKEISSSCVLKEVKDLNKIKFIGCDIYHCVAEISFKSYPVLVNKNNIVGKTVKISCGSHYNLVLSEHGLKFIKINYKIKIIIII